MKKLIKPEPAVSAVSPIDPEQAKIKARKARAQAFREQAQKARDAQASAFMAKALTAKSAPTVIEQANADNENVRVCAREVLGEATAKSERYVHIAKCVPERLTGQSDDAYADTVKQAIKPLFNAVWGSVSNTLGIEPLKKGCADETKKAYNKRKASVMKAFRNASSTVMALAKADVLDIALAELADSPNASPRALMESLARDVRGTNPDLTEKDIEALGSGVPEAFARLVDALDVLNSLVNATAYAQLIKQAKAAVSGSGEASE